MEASLKEQIAGLLHDTSLTAFSHVIDWVFGDPSKEDFQDKLHEDKIKTSEIKDILEKYGFNAEEISNEHDVLHAMNGVVSNRSVNHFCI